MSQPDAYLLLLEKIDRQVDEQGKDIKGLRSDLSDGRLTFKDHANRLAAVEREQATCAERVKESVREVLNEQRDTDRLEKRKPEKPEKQVGETTGMIKAIAKAGPWLRYALIAGVFIGSVVGAAYATHQATKSAAVSP